MNRMIATAVLLLVFGTVAARKSCNQTQLTQCAQTSLGSLNISLSPCSFASFHTQLMKIEASGIAGASALCGALSTFDCCLGGENCAVSAAALQQLGCSYADSVAIEMLLVQSDFQCFDCFQRISKNYLSYQSVLNASSSAILQCDTALVSSVNAANAGSKTNPLAYCTNCANIQTWVTCILQKFVSIESDCVTRSLAEGTKIVFPMCRVAI